MFILPLKKNHEYFLKKMKGNLENLKEGAKALGNDETFEDEGNITNVTTFKSFYY